MRAVLGFLKARAENVAVALMTAMFATFILQIGSRYVFNAPLGWTLELCLTLWLWVVFWGAAFCLDDRDHVKFDLFYAGAGARARRVMAAVSAVAIIAGFVAALPATIDYITFYKIKKSTVMRIRLDVVFSVYAVFALAVIAHYAWRLWLIVRGRRFEAPAAEANVP